MSPQKRPYRSRLVRPCDACRRRRVACVRDQDKDGEVEDGQDSKACSLCLHRGTSCTFVDAPQKRRGNRDTPTRKRRAVSSPSGNTPQTAARTSPLSSVSTPVQESVNVSDGNGQPTFEVRVLGNHDNDGHDPHDQHNGDEESTASWFNGTTMLPDRTCLYSGASSDQDPHLLRHLTYDATGCFGDDFWTVWRVGDASSPPSLSATALPGPQRPSYLTVFPNPHLDCLADMYSQDQVEALFAPHQDELVRLYYEHVHPSYPILEPMADLLARRAAKRVPASLLAVVYNHGAQFWSHSPRAAEGHACPLQREIRPWVFACLSIEARTPNIAVVQATLLFMQMLPRQIRAPNHPGFWPMTNMLVGMAQDIGLHVDPARWQQLSRAERRTRRVLWWAVMTHDKWMAHSLGRPSHIGAARFGGWDVAPLTLADFADDAGCVAVKAVSSVNAFVALCALSPVLADVLDTFYTVGRCYGGPDHESVISKSQALMVQLQRWADEHAVVVHAVPASGEAHQYLVRLTALAVRLSIQRAVLDAVSEGHNGSGNGQEAEKAAADIVDTVRHSLFPLLDGLESAADTDQQPTGLWLSYLRGHLAMVGALLITLVLASVDDNTLDERRDLLLSFRRYLVRLNARHAQGGHYEFARLPLRRLNLIMGELFGEADEEDGRLPLQVSPSSQSPEDAILLWT